MSQLHRYLASVQKFQSDLERKLAAVLDRDARRWFRPAKRTIPTTMAASTGE